MGAVFVIISFTLLLFFLQASAEETKDASISREVRAADAGKKETRLKKGKKQCRGRKARKGKGKKKCKKGKNCRRGKKGEGRKAKGKKGKQGKQGKKKRGGKGRKGKGGKGGKGKKGKGTKRKNRKGGKGKKGRKFRNSGKQNATVPAKCSANTCTASDNVDLFNKYKKNDNMLRQLQRLVRFFNENSCHRQLHNSEELQCQRASHLYHRWH